MESIVKKFCLGEVLLHPGEGGKMPHCKWSACIVTEILLHVRKMLLYFRYTEKLQWGACNLESLKSYGRKGPLKAI